MPTTPARVWAAISEAKGRREGHRDRQRQAGRGRGRRPHPARAFPARGGQPDRDQRRLRHHVLRRVHGPAGRQVGEVLHRARRPGGRAPRSRPSRGWPTARRRDAPGAGARSAPSTGCSAGSAPRAWSWPRSRCWPRTPHPPRTRSGRRWRATCAAAPATTTSSGRCWPPPRGRCEGRSPVIPAPFTYKRAVRLTRPLTWRPRTGTTPSSWPAATRCCR